MQVESKSTAQPLELHVAKQTLRGKEKAKRKANDKLLKIVKEWSANEAPHEVQDCQKMVNQA